MLNQLLNSGWDAETTDTVQLRRIRSTAAIAYLLILVGLPFLLRAFEWHISLRMITVPTAIGLAVIALLVLRFLRHFGISSQLVILAVYVGGAGAVLSGGGIGTSSVGWWIIVPLLAGLLRGLGGGLSWGALVLISIYGCYLAEGYGYQFPDLTPSEYVRSQQLLQALGVSCGVLILLSSYLSQLGYSEQRLVEQNDFLQQQVRRAERAEQELTAALEAKTRFLANMSHEMKTPLNAIVGFSHQLQKHGAEQLDERGQESVEQVIRHSGNMVELVNDLLALSRLDDAGSRAATELRPLDLKEILVRIIHEVSPRAEELGLRIAVDAPDSLVISGHGGQVLQAVNAMVRFALAATKSEEVRVTLGQLSQGALLQVLYEGTLSDQDKARLFDRYNHLHSQVQRDLGISPLALALAHEQARCLSGSISVGCEPEDNTVCFNLFLPF